MTDEDEIEEEVEEIETDEPEFGKVRLQKLLSNAGIASRRRSETLILAGKVTVNGKTAKLGDRADLQKDIVKVNGSVLKPEDQLYYLAVYKPKGYITSRFDPNKRRSVYDLIPKDLRAKVWTVGRLDYFTEGLILFTNDGELTQMLAHPKYEHDKEYEILVSQEFTEAQLDKLRQGVEIGDGDLTQPAKIKVKGENIFMTIHEGKKRQIRRMFAKVGLKIKNLKRIRINKLELGDLPLGKFKYVKKEDII